MVSTIYKRCLQILQICKDKQYFKEVPLEQLKNIIAEHVAGDPRQINLYITRLQTFKFMKQLNPHVMEIQPLQVNREEVHKQQDHLDNIMLKQWGIQE